MHKRIRKRRIIVMLLAFCMGITYIYPSAVAEADAETMQDNSAASVQAETDKANDTAGGPEAEINDSEEPSENKASEESAADTPVAEEDTSEESPEEAADFSFTADQADYLSYDPVYIAKYASDKYVDIESLDLSRFVNIVTAAKGIASYTVDKDKSLDTDTFIAGMTYEMPVYNIDDNSKYYVAIPNVNKFNGKNFPAFGLTVAYNNDEAELIKGWKYEKGILYIPKAAIDDPGNKEDVPEGALIAVQLNYAIGSDTDYGKMIPVQILNGSEPKDKKTYAENIFDLDTLIVDTGVKHRKASDISVFLNGQMIPIYDTAWEYNSSTGKISIQAMPGVVSNVNVVFRPQTTIEKVKTTAISALSFFADEAYAATTSSMSYFTLENGDKGTLIFDTSKMFVGWRGHYSSAVKHGNSSIAGNASSYAGYVNSASQIYGANVTHSGADIEGATDAQKDQWYAALWAIQSYAVAADVRMGSGGAGTLTWNEQVTHYYLDSTSKGTMTIYEWLCLYRNKLEKTNGNLIGNGIGGSSNFIFHLPIGKTVEGSSRAMAHPNGTPLANQNIKFTSTNMSGSLWFAGSCSELGDAAESDDDGDVYVTCLALDSDYVVLAFVQVRSGQNMTAIYKFKLGAGYVRLTKTQKQTTTNFLTEAPNNYTLAGAQYYLYTDSACTTRATDISGNPVTLTTNASGKTQIVGVEPGTYYAKEVTASKGFKLDQTARPVTVTADNTESDPAQISSVEEPAWAEFDFDFRKVDVSGNHGYKQLLDTEYTINYYDVDMGYDTTAPTAAAIAGQAAKRSWTYKTIRKIDESGQPYAGFDTSEDDPISGSSPFYIVDGKIVLPRGVFTIEETKAASGMARNQTVYYCKVYQAQNGEEAISLTDLALTSGTSETSLIINLKDDEQHPVIEIQKKDSDTEEAAAQGANRSAAKGSLAGAKYAVYYDDPALREPERVGTILTDEKGYGKLEKRIEGDSRHIGDWLPLGRYYVEEELASPGYTVDSMYYENKQDEYKNGQHIVVARAQEGNTESFIYTVESLEVPHHTYISKTDITTGGELSGATLQVLDSEGNLVEEWVSTEEPHDIVALHDETQGLKDGKYTLREITAPYGYDVAEDIEFEVRSDAIENTVKMEDKPVYTPEIGTRAGKVKNKKVTDTVTYRNLIPGRTYVMRGWLVNKSIGKKIKGSDGEIEFVPASPNGKVKVELSAKNARGDAVAFEECYMVTTVDGIETEAKVGEHKDLKDKAQTVRIKSDSPKTGEDYMIYLIGGAFVLGAALLAILMKKRFFHN